MAALMYIHVVNNNLVSLLYAGTQLGQMRPEKESPLFVYDICIDTQIQC